MSELEHALRNALADPPTELPTGIREPLWDIEERIHRRRQKQRRSVVAALACAAVAAVVVPMSVYRTAGGSHAVNSDSRGAVSAAGGGQEAVPAAIRKAALEVARSPESHVTGPVRWVRTTSDQLWTLGSYAAAKPRNHGIYVIQLRGRFPCASCLSPIGGMVPIRTVTIPVTAHSTPASPDLQTLGDRRYDLSKLGVVRTFTLR